MEFGEYLLPYWPYGLLVLLGSYRFALRLPRYCPFCLLTRPGTCANADADVSKISANTNFFMIRSLLLNFGRKRSCDLIITYLRYCVKHFLMLSVSLRLADHCQVLWPFASFPRRDKPRDACRPSHRLRQEGDLRGF